MRSKAARIIFIIADITVIVLVSLCAFTDVLTVDKQLWNTGIRKFIFFTVQSNVLAALALLICLPFKFIRLIKGAPLPRFCPVFTLVAVTASTVTFMTVLLFLGPTLGYGSMYLGNNFILHLVCPLLAAVSFAADVYSDKKLSFRYTPLCMLPTALYGAVYMVMVVVIGKERGGWSDFYGFNTGGFWYVSVVVMLAASYLIGVGLWAAHKLAEKRSRSCA